MAEFTDINTVQDLINQNKKQNPTQEILKQIYDLDPADGLRIVQDILNQLSHFHGTAIDEHVENNRPKDAAVWAYDKSMIDTALHMLIDVEL